MKTSAGDGRVRVRISDTGRGISADELAGLFDVGFGTRGSRVGMRLGLSSARHVVQRSGGEIAVQSAPGQGTTFTVELPAAHPAVAGDVAATAGGVSGQVAGEPPLLPSWSKDA